MPKYLALASYTAEGAKAMAKAGAKNRVDAIAAMYEKMGGKLEVYYFAFGEFDVVAIGEVPDNVTAAAMSLAINSSGVAHTKTVVLMTPEEMEQATKLDVGYTPPKA